MPNTDYVKNYTSYSGCDMVVTAQLANSSKIYSLGSLQTISISTHQDKRPVRAIGNVNAKDYTMGQRTIAGSLVFAVFDKHFADEMFKDSLNTAQTGNSTIILPDELPPINLTFTYANEYGHTSRMALYGVRFVDEGQVISVNDIYTENTYQYYATGLEPLNKDSGFGSAHSSSRQNIINNTSKKTIQETNNKENIVSKPSGNNHYIKSNIITLTVDVDNPSSSLEKGLAKFSLNPSQKDGCIYIGGGPFSAEKVINIADYPSDKIYSTSLDIGSYYAYYKNLDNKESNKVSFKVAYDMDTFSITTDTPIIDYVTDKKIAIYSNNTEHNTAMCLPVDGAVSRSAFAVEFKSRKAVFDDLIPNTKYKIITYNNRVEDDIQSSPVYAKTLKYELENLDLLKDFISTNQNLLNHDSDMYTSVLNDITKAPKNLIDEVTKLNCDNEIKPELLLYANKFQNDLTYSYNLYSKIQQPEKIIDNPYFNSFKGDPECEYVNIFKVENSKNIFEERIKNKEIIEYSGRAGKRYQAYSVGALNTRSPRYDFFIFDDETKAQLEAYSNEVNELSKRDVSYIKSKYPFLSEYNTYRLSALYHKQTHKCYLPAPDITIDDELNTSINLNWDDLCQDDYELRIVIADCLESLDHTPFRKIDIKYGLNNYVIDKIRSAVKLNKSYLVWIENREEEIISKISSFNTYLNDSIILIENANIIDNQKQELCNDIENHVLNNMKSTQDIQDIFNHILESEDITESNIYDNIIEYICSNQYCYNSYADIIYFVLQHKFREDITVDNNFAEMKYDKNLGIVSFNTLRQYNISVNVIDPINATINKSIIIDKEKEFTIPYDSNYTLLHLISKDKSRKSGFIFIDNKTRGFYSYKTNVEVSY